MNRIPTLAAWVNTSGMRRAFRVMGSPPPMAGHLLAEAIDGDTSGFDLMASVPTHSFPGGTLLRWPGLVAGMLFYSLRDKLGR